MRMRERGGGSKTKANEAGKSKTNNRSYAKRGKTRVDREITWKWAAS